MRPRPVTAVLAAHWESGSEVGWLTRQVAGALACTMEVHVVTPGSVGTGTEVDGVFTVHRLGTPLDPTAELRRDLLVEGIVTTIARPEHLDGGELAGLLDRDVLTPWEGATSVLDDLGPDLVVIAGHRNLGALAAVERHDREVPVTVIALSSDLESLDFPHFRPLYSRARSILTVTRAEHGTLTERLRRPEVVHRVGAPLSADPSARTEPDLLLVDAEYVLILTSVDSESDHGAVGLSQLLRTVVYQQRVAISHDDGLFVWHRGRLTKGPPVVRSSDLARLMAWARATVDLRPGRLFGRRCVQSLLYGTPIVVPADSRPREHAELGRGGLWFANPAELTWCVEAMFDPMTRASLSTQGQAYAEREFGSPEQFIERVTVACGLGADPVPPPTAATESLVA